MTASKDPAGRVLVVEDRREVVDLLNQALSAAGHDVVIAMDGEEGLAKASEPGIDLVVLDVGLPKRSGMDIARELRSRGIQVPLLMLTARDTVTDRVEGLDAGADDFLSKPFDLEELLARVRALLRRSSLQAAAAQIIVADLTIDPLTREVRRGNRLVALTQKEYALLEFLARRAGEAVGRDEISRAVWKQDLDPSTNIVDVYINYLRKKVDQDSEQPLVHTVRGVGYMIKAG
ncbi:MAG: response regulator transcription factor [Gemmatimonadetes bacterium]|nr:response regulator transcription factor [Gemmatimonadota bacterium]